MVLVIEDSCLHCSHEVRVLFGRVAGKDSVSLDEKAVVNYEINVVF